MHKQKWFYPMEGKVLESVGGSFCVLFMYFPRWFGHSPNETALSWQYFFWYRALYLSHSHESMDITVTSFVRKTTTFWPISLSLHSSCRYSCFCTREGLPFVVKTEKMSKMATLIEPSSKAVMIGKFWNAILVSLPCYHISSLSWLYEEATLLTIVHAYFLGLSTRRILPTYR